MTQTRPEACTCRKKPAWCDPCLESGFARTWDDHAMPVPSVHAALKAELIATALENVRLKRELATLTTENAALHATVAHLIDQQHANEPAPDAPTHAAPFPASALRQRHQAIGLLSTADAGRVRLGGYAPTLPR